MNPVLNLIQYWFSIPLKLTYETLKQVQGDTS